MLVRAFLAIVASTPLAFANVIVVSQTGPVTSIQNAVNVAVDGDVILVKSGSYTGFEILDKSLSVVADTGATVTISGMVAVRSLAATREVVLAGLDVDAAPATAAGSVDGLALTQDAGTVRVLDCSFRGAYVASSPCASGRGASVLGSLDVAFVQCGLHGASATSQLEAFGGKGLHVHTSRVALFDCTIEGGHGGNDTTCWDTYPYGDGQPGGDALHAEGSSVFASGTTMHGGDGGNALAGMGYVHGGDGGTGVRANGIAPSTSCDVHLLGCAMISGIGGSTPSGMPGTTPPPSLIFGATTFGILAGSARHLDVPTVARAGSVVPVSFTGATGDDVTLILSTAGEWRYIALFAGVELTPFAPRRLLSFGDVPASGTLASSVRPPLFAPGLLEREFHLQSLHQEVAGTWRLGPERVLVVVDPSF